MDPLTFFPLFFITPSLSFPIFWCSCVVSMLVFEHKMDKHFKAFHLPSLVLYSHILPPDSGYDQWLPPRSQGAQSQSHSLDQLLHSGGNGYPPGTRRFQEHFRKVENKRIALFDQQPLNVLYIRTPKTGTSVQ